MIVIICQNGTIDATGCRIHIKTGGGYSLYPNMPATDVCYNLTLTNLDTKADYIISQFSVEREAEFTHQHIINAINNREPSVDIRDLETAKSETGDP